MSLKWVVGKWWEAISKLHFCFNWWWKDTWCYNLFADKIIGGNQRKLVPSPLFSYPHGYLCLWGQYQLWKQLKMPAQSHRFIDTEEPSVHWHWGVQYLSICLWLNFPTSVQNPAYERWKPCLQKTSASSRYKVQGRAESNICLCPIPSPHGHHSFTAPGSHIWNETGLGSMV